MAGSWHSLPDSQAWPQLRLERRVPAPRGTCLEQARACPSAVGGERGSWSTEGAFPSREAKPQLWL